MTIHYPPPPSHESRKDIYTLFQAILTGIAVFLFLNTALGFYLYGLFEYAINPQNGEQLLAYWLPASGFFISGVILCLPTILSISRWFGWKAPSWLENLKIPRLRSLLFAFLAVLVTGYEISTHSFTTAIFLPFLHMGGIVIPILFALGLGLRGVVNGSAQRKWGAFSVGLGLAPPLIFLIETIALVIFVLTIAVYISQDEALSREIGQFAYRLRSFSAAPEEIFQQVQPYLSQPTIVLLILFFSAIVVPLIEEAIKPLAVWMLSTRLSTSAEGFSAGALSGAGYALLESFLLASTREQWVGAVIGRSGTAFIHIFTAALMGSALVEAWRQRRYFRLAIAYLCAVFLHGSWNALAILFTLRTLTEGNQGFWSIEWANRLAYSTPLSITAIATLLAIGLWRFNHLLRKKSGTISPPSPENKK